MDQGHPLRTPRAWTSTQRATAWLLPAPEDCSGSPRSTRKRTARLQRQQAQPCWSRGFWGPVPCPGLVGGPQAVLPFGKTSPGSHTTQLPSHTSTSFSQSDRTLDFLV